MCSQGINQNPRISKSRCKEEKIVKTPMDALVAYSSSKNALSPILETPFLAENLINHWLHHGHESLHHWYPQRLLQPQFCGEVI